MGAFYVGEQLLRIMPDITDCIPPPPPVLLPSVPVRLHGGTRLSGIVQVLHDGVWGVVCDDKFTIEAAKVVCQQLG